MNNTLILSKKSQQLIEQYHASLKAAGCEAMLFPSGNELPELLAWLASEINLPIQASLQSRQAFDFLLTALRAKILRDLLVSLDPSQRHTEDEPPPSSTTWLKWYLLAASGMIVAACEGFDTIYTLFSYFAFPPIIALFTAFIFSAFSVIAFYAFALAQISKNLGMKFTDTPKLLDIYVVQMDTIKSICNVLNSENMAIASLDELAAMDEIIRVLQLRFTSLTKSGKEFEKAINTPAMQFMKNTFVGLTGLLYFVTGFVLGLSVAQGILGIAVTFWPVILFSVAVGLAAFSMYWYMQRIGVQQLISGWFGFDEEKINALCDENVVSEEAAALERLAEKVRDMISLRQQLTPTESSTQEVAPQSTTSTANIPTQGRRGISFFSSLAEESSDSSSPVDESSETRRIRSVSCPF